MTYHLFADALLARGLAVCGLKEAEIVDPAAHLTAAQDNGCAAVQAANPDDGTRSNDSANPTAWHALLKTH
jgi:hypothetical protein